MSQTAAHLVDRVLPDVPWRQWVLTLPFGLRYCAAYDPKVLNIILTTFIRSLRSWQRRRAIAAGIPNPHWGAVTAVQRAGSALQLTPHFHTLAMDGVFAIDLLAGTALFHPLEPPTDADVERLVAAVAKRSLAALARRGLLPDGNGTCDEPDRLALDQPATAACYASAVQGRFAFGEHAGRRLPRLGAHPDAPVVETKRPLNARSQGFDLHAAVAVEADHRDRLEQLCRYLCRPPLAHDRLTLQEDGRITLRLKTPYSDGSTHLILTPEALIERLCALVPRPRTHRIRYHGCLAPSAGARRLVVPLSPGESDEPPPSAKEPASTSPAAPSDRTRFRWMLWAELMKRVLSVDPLLCPNCSGRMRPVAAIFRADVIAAILECLGLPTEAPPIQHARAPPEPGLVEFDLT